MGNQSRRHRRRFLVRTAVLLVCATWQLLCAFWCVYRLYLSPAADVWLPGYYEGGLVASIGAMLFSALALICLLVFRQRARDGVYGEPYKFFSCSRLPPASYDQNWFTRLCWSSYVQIKDGYPDSLKFECAALVMIGLGAVLTGSTLAFSLPMFSSAGTGSVSMGILLLGNPLAEDIDTR